MRRGPANDDSIDRIGRSYDRFAGALYRYALMILADPSGAADPVQQVFVAVLSQAADIDDDERYLRRAVRNECFSALRQRTRSIVTAVDAPLLEAVAATADRPVERLALEQALRGLPPEQREVVQPVRCTPIEPGGRHVRRADRRG